MKIKNILTALCLMVTFNAISQNQGKVLLSAVSKKVKSYHNIVLDFKYVLENVSENMKQETKGDVIMQGENYRLNIFGVTRIFDGKKLYNISPEDQEVTISSESENEDDAITPSKMLSFYEDGYMYEMDIQQNVKGRKIQYIKIIPIDSNSEIEHILLGVDTQTKHIYNLIQVGKNRTKTTLTINSFKTNEPLSKTVFTFNANKYQDYYINNIN